MHHQFSTGWKHFFANSAREHLISRFNFFILKLRARFAGDGKLNHVLVIIFIVYMMLFLQMRSQKFFHEKFLITFRTLERLFFATNEIFVIIQRCHRIENRHAIFTRKPCHSCFSFLGGGTNHFYSIYLLCRGYKIVVVLHYFKYRTEMNSKNFNLLFLFLTIRGVGI